MGNLTLYIGATSVGAGDVAIFWLGGAGFAFKTAAGKIIFIDPYLSDCLDHRYSWKRLPLSPIPFAPDEVKPDLVLVTHAHDDHLDPETIPVLAAASGAVFAGPASCVSVMRGWGIAGERLVEINRGESRVICGVPVSAAFAHHVSPAGGETPDAVGYVVDLDGVVIYHTGDTLYHPDLRSVKALQPQVILPCINGQYGNMSAAEAAQLTCEIDAAVVIPMHWGLVAENTVDPACFVAALARIGSRARPVVLAPGEVYVHRGSAVLV